MHTMRILLRTHHESRRSQAEREQTAVGMCVRLVRVVLPYHLLGKPVFTDAPFGTTDEVGRTSREGLDWVTTTAAGGRQVNSINTQ